MCQYLNQASSFTKETGKTSPTPTAPQAGAKIQDGAKTVKTSRMRSDDERRIQVNSLFIEHEVDAKDLAGAHLRLRHHRLQRPVTRFWADARD